MKKSAFYIVGITMKVAIYLALFSLLTVNNAIVWGVEPLIQYLYAIVSVVCFVAFGLTFWVRWQKPAYIVFGVFFVCFILMGKYVSQIKEQLDMDVCLDGGMVYDPVQKICRNDCWKWDDKLGCLKE